MMRMWVTREPVIREGVRRVSEERGGEESG